MNSEHPPGPLMTLGNMREQGVQHLNACRHRSLIDKRLDRLEGRDG
jgi:hypothetical protein